MERYPKDILRNPRKKRTAHLSQNMNFLADMIVEEFIPIHANSRSIERKI